jgi:enoyl-CoA hydratase/carnithine racemase
MPEITIGLYPDVGASWFLPRLPARLGLFLALSGVGLNAVDALHANLADHILAQDAYPALLEGLAALHWRADPRQHHEQISALISAMETDVPLPGQLMRHFDTLRRMMQHGSLDQVCDGILQADFDDPWLQQAQRGLAQGCPTTAALSWEIFRRSQGLSLAQALRMELILSVNICARPDFSEGVRALLVDKDRQPRWCRQREQIDHDWIDSHFISPWSAAQHPLAQLGNTP